jgi:hypothetical protein
MRHRRPLLALLAVLALAACGRDLDGRERPPLGAPITGLAKNAWTWVDFPDARCDDGSTTGVGVSPGDDPSLSIFLDGGGACWSWLTCVLPRGTDRALAASGPFQKPQFEARARSVPGSILDRATEANPFKAWTLVYVPYCTGDVHAGENVAEYKDPLGLTTFSYHHVGHANVVAYLKRLVVSGASAGGFGAVANYDTFRRYWPDARSYLVDDSGPPLPSGDVGRAQTDRFDAAWKLYALLDTFCPACRDDISASFAALTARYPRDRMSLLSYLDDPVIEGFFLVNAPTFTGALDHLAHGELDAHANTKYFLVAGRGHAVLGRPGDFRTGGVGLWEFLARQSSDSPSWVSAAP